MSELPFRYMIGLEVHVELSTVTKMFCRCLNAPFGAEPNRHTCPVCIGLPGALPVPNKEAVRNTILVGKALGSEVPRLSKWDRKHYFYPDLPKGYQISQYDLPLCLGGQLELLGQEGQAESVVRFERVHLEEDAGKLMHTGRAGYSKVDLNRAGVPLIEMVSKPDLTSPEQARRFLQELRLLVRTLGVSDADMEKGQLRCDVNVSIHFEHQGQEVHTPVTEVKNVNSTRAVERSIQVEGQRLYAEWITGGPVRERTHKLTAGWDEDRGEVRINRTKEAANEYRYFPEPDLPPLMVYELPELDPEKMVLPELPNDRRRRYLKEGVSLADSDTLLADPNRLVRFESFLDRDLSGKTVANWLINAPQSAAFPDECFVELLSLQEQGMISFAAVKQHLEPLLSAVTAGKTVQEALTALQLLQQHDEDVVQSAVAEVLHENPQAVAEFQEGKEKVLGFLVGQVMRRTAGKAQPAKVQEAVRKALNGKQL